MILKTLAQLPLVCMDGLTLFFIAMLNPACQEEKVLRSLFTCTGKVIAGIPGRAGNAGHFANLAL